MSVLQGGGGALSRWSWPQTLRAHRFEGALEKEDSGHKTKNQFKEEKN